MHTDSHGAAGQRSPGLGFPRAFRLRRRSEFRRIQSGGRRVHAPHFMLVVLAEGPSRIGITVSRKVSPSAVVRNRIKRRIREVYRRHRSQFPEAATVVIAKRGAHELPYTGIADELLRASAAATRKIGRDRSRGGER